MKKILFVLNIVIEERPLRSSHKNKIVERNNGAFESVLDRLPRERFSASTTMTAARASFLTNILKGSKILSPPLLARGYLLSIAEIHSTMVPQHLPDAHLELAAAKVIYKTLNVRPGQSISLSALCKGIQIWVFFIRQKKNNRKIWIEVRVVGNGEHIVKYR